MQHKQLQKSTRKVLPKVKELGKVGIINIPKKVEDIIDILHARTNNLEWSGILFFKPTHKTASNLLKFKDLEFDVEFIYPMDIGSHTFTAFKYDQDILGAYELDDKLLEINTGLVHSHASMNTFFSGTDTEELLTNAVNYNYYISLIVNKGKEYCCKIAFPSKNSIVNTYTLKNHKGKEIKVQELKDEVEILVGDLTPVIKTPVKNIPWLSDRISTIKENKQNLANSFKSRGIVNNHPAYTGVRWAEDDGMYWGESINGVRSEGDEYIL
jgi:proteasome lid subunit RPN8/RPN11